MEIRIECYEDISALVLLEAMVKQLAVLDPRFVTVADNGN